MKSLVIAMRLGIFCFEQVKLLAVAMLPMPTVIPHGYTMLEKLYISNLISISFGNHISFLQCNIYILYFSFDCSNSSLKLRITLSDIFKPMTKLFMDALSQKMEQPPQQQQQQQQRLDLLSVGTKFYGFKHGLAAPNEHVMTKPRAGVYSVLTLSMFAYSVFEAFETLRLTRQQTVMIVEAPPQYFYAQGHCANVSDSLGSVRKGHTTQMFYKQVNKEMWLTDRKPHKRSNKCRLLDIVHGFVGSRLFELSILRLFPYCVWPCVN